MASALALAHIEGQRRLREIAKSGVTRIWDGLPGHDQANLDQWLSEVLPLVESSQRASLGLTQSYLARAIERPPVGINPADVIGAAARNGTPPEKVYTRPFVTLWSELKDGKRFEEAAAMGLDRATGAAAMDVQLAMRGTLGAYQRAEPRIMGYERVADGGACLFCLECSGAKLRYGDAMPLHLNCGCGIEAVLEEYVETTPLPESVAVAEHGEYGPVLVDPGQHFMTRAEAMDR